jgi:hypothetical protein
LGLGTAFTHLGVQASLPAQIGLIAQWMSGRTDWIQGAGSDGTISPFAEFVRDEFDSRFLMLTRLVHGSHRVSVRYDDSRCTATARRRARTPTMGTLGR